MNDFFKQAVPEKWSVLGLTLKPLTVGHIILLHRIESAFVCAAQDDFDVFREIALAVAICSQDYADGLALIYDAKSTQKAMGLWALKLTRSTLLDRLLGRKPVAIPIASEWDAFADYMRQNTKIPYYSYSPDDMKEISCPQVQLVKVSLQRAFGFSDAVMMDRSWQQCLWDHITLKAIDGQVQMTDQDHVKDALEFANQLAEKLARKGGMENGSP